MPRPVQRHASKVRETTSRFMQEVGGCFDVCDETMSSSQCCIKLGLWWPNPGALLSLLHVTGPDPNATNLEPEKTTNLRSCPLGIIPCPKTRRSRRWSIPQEGTDLLPCSNSQTLAAILVAVLSNAVMQCLCSSGHASARRGGG